MAERLDTTLKNDLAEIARLAERVEQFGEAAALPFKVVYRINLVLEELLTNTISYGYQDRAEHEIRVLLLAENGKVTVEIVDDGAPFNPLEEAPMPDLEAEVDQRAIGGLGVHLVRQLAERADHTRDGRHNHLTLVISAAAE